MFQSPSEERRKSRAPAGHLVRLAGIGTAVPAARYTQSQILDLLLTQEPRPASAALYKKILAHPSIETRHFAFEDPSEAFEKDPDKINSRFEREGAKLGTEALVKALADANLRPIDIDFLIVATCTGYICPGLSSHIIERAGLTPQIHFSDIVGMGCGGALPALELANNFVKANPGSNAAVVCVEICSAAFFMGDHADLIVSNSIFSDGAAAVIVTNRLEGGDARENTPVLKQIESLVIPQLREELRFKSEQGRLRNVLGIEVPDHAAAALKKLTSRLIAAHGLTMKDIRHWMIHPGGHTVLKQAEIALELAPSSLEVSRKVLREHGNMSSASVLFVLAETLTRSDVRAGDWAVISSFGAGFSAFAALVRFA